MEQAKKKRFLIALEKQGSVSAACKVAKVGRTSVYREARSDMEFRRQWEDVHQAAADALEVEARRRAFDGSDTLLIFLLKANRPSIYRETQMTGAHMVEWLTKVVDILYEELGADAARRVFRRFQGEVLGGDLDEEPAPLGLDAGPG